MHKIEQTLGLRSKDRQLRVPGFSLLLHPQESMEVLSFPALISRRTDEAVDGRTMYTLCQTVGQRSSRSDVGLLFLPPWTGSVCLGLASEPSWKSTENRYHPLQAVAPTCRGGRCVLIRPRVAAACPALPRRCGELCWRGKVLFPWLIFDIACKKNLWLDVLPPP